MPTKPHPLSRRRTRLTRSRVELDECRVSLVKPAPTFCFWAIDLPRVGLILTKHKTWWATPHPKAWPRRREEQERTRRGGGPIKNAYERGALALLDSSSTLSNTRYRIPHQPLALSMPFHMRLSSSMCNSIFPLPCYC